MGLRESAAAKKERQRGCVLVNVPDVEQILNRAGEGGAFEDLRVYGRNYQMCYLVGPALIDRARDMIRMVYGDADSYLIDCYLGVSGGLNFSVCQWRDHKLKPAKQAQLQIDIGGRKS